MGVGGTGHAVKKWGRVLWEALKHLYVMAPFLFSFRSSSRVGFRMKHAQHHCTAFQDEAILLNTGVERLVAIWALPHDDRDSNKY